MEAEKCLYGRNLKQTFEFVTDDHIFISSCKYILLEKLTNSTILEEYEIEEGDDYFIISILLINNFNSTIELGPSPDSDCMHNFLYNPRYPSFRF